MGSQFRSWLTVSASLPLATALAAAQPVPGSVQGAPSAAAPVAAPAAAEPAPAPPPPVAELPPPLWSVPDAEELLRYIRGVGREGLDPADYDPAGLSAAITRRDPEILSRAATDRFYKLAGDLALGHVKRKDRQDWYVTDKDLADNREVTILLNALVQHRIGDALNGLLPTHPQYGALRHALALADPKDTANIHRIRLNMDRWRWLPRDLGSKYVIVNVPSFHATLVENGVTRWKHRAIAGATKTPTPQLSALATGVILNPWWEVPKSIEPEVRGRKGYVPVKGKDGKVQRWRQPPGPANALGQVKFVMPNAHAIFLHDTNARSRFNSQVRALSHGCVRTENVLDLAAELLADDGGEWTRAKIDETLASKKTVEAKFVKPVPIYIVYFSSAALVDGQIVNYQDLYRRDARALAALLDRGGAPAAKTAVAAK